MVSSEPLMRRQVLFDGGIVGGRTREWPTTPAPLSSRPFLCALLRSSDAVSMHKGDDPQLGSRISLNSASAIANLMMSCASLNHCRK